MRRIAVSAMRERISDVVGHVMHRRERVVLTRHGKEVWAIVPMEDLARLERFEHFDAPRERRSAVDAHRVSWRKVTEAFHRRHH